jgi:hypothetical protein
MQCKSLIRHFVEVLLNIPEAKKFNKFPNWIWISNTRKQCQTIEKFSSNVFFESSDQSKVFFPRRKKANMRKYGFFSCCTLLLCHLTNTLWNSFWCWIQCQQCLSSYSDFLSEGEWWILFVNVPIVERFIATLVFPQSCCGSLWSKHCIKVNGTVGNHTPYLDTSLWVKWTN